MLVETPKAARRKNLPLLVYPTSVSYNYRKILPKKDLIEPNILEKKPCSFGLGTSVGEEEEDVTTTRVDDFSSDTCFCAAGMRCLLCMFLSDEASVFCFTGSGGKETGLISGFIQTV
jgi:hypothetical protein